MDNNGTNMLQCNYRNNGDAPWVEGTIPKCWYTKLTFFLSKVVRKRKSTFVFPPEIGNKDNITICILSLIHCLEIKQLY